MKCCNHPTLKFWIREGLLPPGKKLNATTASYGESHLHRIALIRYIRTSVQCSTTRIRELTNAIDSDAPRIRVIELSQRIALELTHPQAENLHPRVAALCERIGWPVFPSWAGEELAAFLIEAEDAGLQFTDEFLDVYATAFKLIAGHNVNTVSSAQTPDELALQVVRGITIARRLENTMSALAHTSVSLALNTSP